MHGIQTEEKKRRSRSSPIQLQEMISFMEKNKPLVDGKITKTLSAEKKYSLWIELREILNNCGKGPAKSEEAWKKTWIDIKSRVVSKVIALQKSDADGLEKQLSPFEERVANLIKSTAVLEQQNDTEIISKEADISLESHFEEQVVETVDHKHIQIERIKVENQLSPSGKPTDLNNPIVTISQSKGLTETLSEKIKIESSYEEDDSTFNIEPSTVAYQDSNIHTETVAMKTRTESPSEDYIIHSPTVDNQNKIFTESNCEQVSESENPSAKNIAYLFHSSGVVQQQNEILTRTVPGDVSKINSSSTNHLVLLIPSSAVVDQKNNIYAETLPEEKMKAESPSTERTSFMINSSTFAEQQSSIHKQSEMILNEENKTKNTSAGHIKYLIRPSTVIEHQNKILPEQTVPDKEMKTGGATTKHLAFLFRSASANNKSNKILLKAVSEEEKKIENPSGTSNAQLIHPSTVLEQQNNISSEKFSDGIRKREHSLEKLIYSSTTVQPETIFMETVSEGPIEKASVTKKPKTCLLHPSTFAEQEENIIKDTTPEKLNRNSPTVIENGSVIDNLEVTGTDLFQDEVYKVLHSSDTSLSSDSEEDDVSHQFLPAKKKKRSRVPTCDKDPFVSVMEKILTSEHEKRDKLHDINASIMKTNDFLRQIVANQKRHLKILKERNRLKALKLKLEDDRNKIFNNLLEKK